MQPLPSSMLLRRRFRVRPQWARRRGSRYDATRQLESQVGIAMKQSGHSMQLPSGRSVQVSRRLVCTMQVDVRLRQCPSVTVLREEKSVSISGWTRHTRSVLAFEYEVVWFRKRHPQSGAHGCGDCVRRRGLAETAHVGAGIIARVKRCFLRRGLALGTKDLRQIYILREMTESLRESASTVLFRSEQGSCRFL